MDDIINGGNSNISIVNPKRGGNGDGNGNGNQISALVLDHLFSSSPSISSILAAAVATSVASSRVSDVAHLASTRVPPSGFGPTALVHGSSRRPAPEVDVDGYDCESEEGVDVVVDEPVKPSPHRSSGSKRSRAAEVHNLSEKRRRSRINEKMKALQSLIPNSNKTDKASMLDEAIEYLKQLQLQVQMLSMRTGLSLSPAILPGEFPAMQSSEMCLRFGVGNAPSANLGMNATRVSLIQDSLHLTNQCTSSLRSEMSHGSDMKDTMLAFTAGSSLAQPSNVQHGSFGLSVNPLEIYGTAPHPQLLGAFHMTRPEPHVTQLSAAVPQVCSSVSEVGGETTEGKLPVPASSDNF